MVIDTDFTPDIAVEGGAVRATGPQGLAGMAPPQALADHVHGLWAGFARDGGLPWPEFGSHRMVYRMTRGEAFHEPAMPAAAFLPE